jgi:hypothetical protein
MLGFENNSAMGSKAKRRYMQRDIYPKRSGVERNSTCLNSWRPDQLAGSDRHEEESPDWIGTSETRRSKRRVEIKARHERRRG